MYQYWWWVVSVGLLISLLPVGLQAQIPEQSSQLLLSVTEDWSATTGELWVFHRSEDGWSSQLGPFPVNVGREGLAWGLGLHRVQPGPRKREGDGKAPAGIFTLGPAFGYPDVVKTGLEYLPMRDSHYCIDVPDSPLYNRTVDALEVGEEAVKGSSEAMRRDTHFGDQQYKKGIFVAHNPENISYAGSCIFIHLWDRPGGQTAGCTAMDERRLDALLLWLEDSANPVYVSLPRIEYDRLRDAWGLPVVDVGSLRD